MSFVNQTIRSYKKGQLIPIENQEVWVVCQGIVLLSTVYETGEEAILGLAGPSTPFGLPFTKVEPYQATALSPVNVIKLSWFDLEQSPTLAQDVLQSLNHRLQQTEVMLALLGQRRVEDRLRQFLLMLKQEVGQPEDGGGTWLGVRLTHQHLATALGTSRVTITRLMGQMRKEGKLDIDRNRHIILSPCL